MSARTPQELSQLFAQHVNAGKIDSLMELYEPGATLPDQEGRAHVGRDDIRTRLTPMVQRDTDLTCEVTKVIEAGDIALVHNRWKMTGASGLAFEVCRRQDDGSWLYVIDDPFNAAPG